LIEGTSIYLKNSVCQVNYSAHMPLTRECQSKLYKTYTDLNLQKIGGELIHNENSIRAFRIGMYTRGGA
jgi:hypothetical protein